MIDVPFGCNTVWQIVPKSWRKILFGGKGLGTFRGPIIERPDQVAIARDDEQPTNQKLFTKFFMIFSNDLNFLTPSMLTRIAGSRGFLSKQIYIFDGHSASWITSGTIDIAALWSTSQKIIVTICNSPVRGEPVISDFCGSVDKSLDGELDSNHIWVPDDGLKFLEVQTLSILTGYVAQNDFFLSIILQNHFLFSGYNATKAHEVFHESVYSKIAYGFVWKV